MDSSLGAWIVDGCVGLCDEGRDVGDGSWFVGVGEVSDFVVEAANGEWDGVVLGLVGEGEWNGLELELNVVEAREGAGGFAAEGFVRVEEMSVGHCFECPTEVGGEFTTATPQGCVDVVVQPFVEIKA